MLWCMIGFGQNYIPNAKTLEKEDRLNHFELESVFKDSRGLIWISTRHGLDSYDGNKFTSWTNGKANDLEKVLNFHEDKAGFIWLLTTTTWSSQPTGISLIDVHTHKIFSFEEKFGYTIDIPFNKIQTITTNLNKDIFICTDRQIYHYSSDHGFNTFPLLDNSPYSINDVAEKTISINVNHKIFTLDFTGQVLDSIDLAPVDPYLESIPVYINDELVYYSKGKGFCLRKGDHFEPLVSKGFKEIAKYKIPINILLSTCAYNKKDNTYWFVRNRNQLLVMHPDKGIVYELNNEIYDIEQIYIDDDGIAWITAKGGLVQMMIDENKFKRFLSTDLAATGELRLTAQSNSTLSIATFNNTLYITSENHDIDQIDEGGKLFKLFPKQPIYSVLELTNKQILFGTEQTLHLYEDKQFMKSIPIGARSIWQKYQNKNDKIWLSSNPSLTFLSNINEQVKTFKNYKDFPAFKGAKVHQLFQKNKNEVLLATTKGVFMFNIDENKIIGHFSSKGEGKYYIPHDIVHHLYRDKQEENVYWLATTEGLVRSNIETFEHQVFNIQSGFPDNVIYAVYEDDFNHLWMSSNYGIIRMNKNNFQVHSYLLNDGITHHEFSQASHHQGKDGMIYFGGLNGVTAFHPKDFSKQQVSKKPIPLEITQFQFFSNQTEELSDKTLELLQEKKIVINPADGFFILDFALLDYKHRSKVLYAYKIEGLDKTWNYTYQNSIRIAHLPYGDYVLKIKGQTHQGNFSEKEIEIPIKVIRPYYLTVWFILFCITVLAGLSYLVYQWRTLQLKEKNQELEELVEERTAQLEADKLVIEKQTKKLKKLDRLKSRFFVNVSHELRTPLTLILSPTQVLLKNIAQLSNHEINKLLSSIQQNAFKLLNLTEQVLQLSKLEAQKLTLENEEVLFYNYFNRFFRSFEPIAKANELDYSIGFQIDKTLLIQLDRKKFEHVVGNLISNALKYTPSKGQVSVNATTIGNQLKIEVKDNGLGIHKDDLPYIFDRYYQTQKEDRWVQGTGIGLALAKELAELFNGKLSVTSEYQKGSSFLFTMPFTVITSANSSNSFETPATNIAVLTNISILSNTLQKEKIVINENENLPQLLVVEDNIELKIFLVLILSKHYHITTADNGQDAIAQLHMMEKLPALILSDIMMPKMDGFELLEKIKNHPKWSRIPIILLTAKTGIEDKLKALTIGIDDYITKPFIIEELFARIENSLNNATHRQQANLEDEAQVNPINDNKIALLPKDSLLINSLNVVLEREIKTNNLRIGDIALELMIGERQLRRRIKLSTGLSPVKYIREFKLNKSRYLLESGQVNNLSEVTYAVGFDTPHYFAAKYEERFGKKPQFYFQQSKTSTD